MNERPSHEITATGAVRHRRRGTLLAGAAVVLALVVSACGGGENSSGPDPTSASADTRPTDTPRTDTPSTDSAPSTVPSTDVPSSDVPSTDVSSSDVPSSDVPSTTVLEQPTAWDGALAAIGPDGEIDLDTARRLFSMAVGPLPGTDAPTDDLGEVPSGTMAIFAMMRHLDELSADERTAVAEALAPLDADGKPLLPSAGQGLRRSEVGGITIPNPCTGGYSLTQDVPGTDAYRPLVDSAISKLAPLLGPLPIPVHLGFRGGTAPADAAAYGTDCAAPATSCTVRINRNQQPNSFMRSALVHEVVHCYQSFVVPITVAAGRKPWMIEGFPTWAAAKLEDPRHTASFWRDYLTTPGKSLFSRAYDAWPMWAHVELSGQSPWETFTATLLAGDSVAALQTTTGSAWPAFGDTWGSGLLRDPSRGSAWQTTGPGITADRAIPISLALPPSGVDVLSSDVAATRLMALDLAASQVVFVDVSESASGRWSFDGGRDLLLSDLAGTALCVLDDCTCPAGTPGIGRQLVQAESIGAVVAVTGLHGAAQVQLTSATLTEACGTGPVYTEELDPCLVGEWESTPFEVPGDSLMPPATGGAGAILRIDPNGVVAVDLAEMEAFVGYLSEIDTIVQAWSSGLATATMSSAAGELIVEAVDLSGVIHHMQAGPRTMNLPGGPGNLVIPVDDQPYECSRSTLSLKRDDPMTGQTITVTFDRN